MTVTYNVSQGDKNAGNKVLPSIAIRSVPLTQHCSGYQIENESGWASSTDGGERHVQGFGGKT